MLTLAGTLLLAAVTLLAISLQRTYSRIPRKELKRRAATGDEMAQGLYRAVAYGMSLQVLLWVIIGLSSAGFFVVSARIFPSWLAVLAALVLLWLGFAWLPRTKMTKVGNQIAHILTPPIASVLNRIYPPLSRFSDLVRRYGRIHIHTGLYEKDDLITLLDQQEKQPDNRISTQELQIVRGALLFGDKFIRDIMTPRRAVTMVTIKDTIGPILMNELHDSGHSRFPVYQDKEDNVVGTLYIRDLIAAKAGGKVEDIMHKKVYYVHDEQLLNHALQAFLKTERHLFIVVNNFEEFVGVITIEDILEQILGNSIIDEFDKYDDMRAVAQLEAAHERKTRAGKTLN